MGVVTAITAALAIAGGVTKAIQAKKAKKKARQLIEDYNRQEITNPFDNLKVSTLGAMRQQEVSARNTATAFNNLRRTGANAVIGGSGRIVRGANEASQAASARLDEQQNRNQVLEARGSADVIRMKELREREDLAGLGTAMNVANQDMWGGVSDIVGGVGVLGGAAQGAFGGGANPQTGTTNNFANNLTGAEPTVDFNRAFSSSFNSPYIT